MALIPGLNVNPCGYYAGVWPFNNMMHGAAGEIPGLSGGWTGLSTTYVDADLWITGAPNNTNVYTKLHDADQDPLLTYQHLRTGRYTVTWTGLWTLTLEGTAGMYTVTENLPNRYSIDISDGKSVLNCRIQNSTTGGPTLNASNNIKIFHEDDEDDAVADVLWQRNYVQAHKHAKILRFMDCQIANITVGTALEYSDIPTMNHRTWGNLRYPYKLMAMLCAEVQADMWLSFPVTTTVDHMRRAAADIASVTAFTGKIYLEAGNEVWLFTITRAYLRDYIGKGLDPDGDGQTIALYTFNTGAVLAAKGDTATYNAQSDNHKCANAMGLVMSRLWDAFETATVYGAVPGRSKTRRVHAGQTTSFGANQAALWQYDIVATSTRLKDMIDVGAIAPYIDPIATAAIPTITLPALIRAKNYLNPLSDWLDVFKAGITLRLAAWETYRTSLATMSPQAAFHTYECGVQQYVTLFSIDAQYFAYTLDTAGNDSMDFGTSIATAFDDGEQVHLSGGSSTPSASLSAGGLYYIRKNGTNKLWIYATLAAYNADTVPDGTGAAALNASAGTRYATNWTRQELLDTRIKQFLNSSYGRALYDDYKTRAFDGKFVSFIHFSDLGGSWIGGCWDIDDTQFTTVTKRSKWLKDKRYCHGTNRADCV